MAFENKVKMSIEDWRKYENDEDYEFAYGTVDFLSTKKNSHNHLYSEEVIKEYAPTVIGKWVLAEYDNFEGDVTEHTENQKIVGFVPQQDIKYRYDEDNDLIASVDIVMSKLYANDVYSLFREYNYRNVSIEELVGFTPETKNYVDGGDKPKIVEGFNITGITILGLKYKPSVPNANIKLTQMSEKEIEKEYVKYSEHKMTEKDNFVSHPVNKSKEALDEGDWNGDKAKQDLIKEKNFKTLAKSVCMKLEEGWEDRQVTKLGYPIMNIKEGEWVYNRKGLASALGYAQKENESAVVSKIQKIYKKLGLDQEKKMNDILEKLENIENQLKEETMAKEKEKVAPKEEDVKVDEKETKTTDTQKEPDTKAEVTDDDTAKKEEEPEKEDDTETKMAGLKSELETTKAELETYKAKVKTLEKYKADVETAKKDSIVQSTLSQIKGSVDESKYAEIEKASKECAYENIGAWKNNALAQAYVSVMSKSTEKDMLDMGMVQTEKKDEPTSIYD